MTVKDIIKNASAMLYREDVLSYLNNETENIGEDTLPTVNVMTNLLNLVVGELAGTFIPMVKREKVTTKNEKITYASLNERCIRVIAVYDLEGNELSMSRTPEYIKVYQDKVIVEYEYSPPMYDLESEIGYKESDITMTALSYGLCAEYSISIGNFEQAVMWHERYVNSIAEQRKIKNSRIKERSFL